MFSNDDDGPVNRINLLASQEANSKLVLMLTVIRYENTFLCGLIRKCKCIQYIENVLK